MMLEIRNISVAVDSKLVIKGASLSIDDDELHVLMGPNGAGKSTLLQAVMGLPRYRIIEGKVLVEGEDVTGLPLYERARRGIALAFQNPPSMKGVTVKCILEAMEKIYGAWSEKTKYTRILGISSLLEKPLGSMSGGERKRAELFLALAQRPRVLLLDEPDSGVDIDSLNAIADTIEDVVSRGVAVLLVSHTVRFLEELVDRGIVEAIHVLIDGRIRVSDEPHRVLKLVEEKGLRAAGAA
jgi:Fe-S cluster assembly ATP-binding protein